MADVPPPPPPPPITPLSSTIHVWFISSEEVWQMSPHPHPIHCSYWCCDSMRCGTAVVFWPVFFHSTDTRQKDQTQIDTLPGRQVWRWPGRQPGMQTHTHTHTTTHTITTHTHAYTVTQSSNQSMFYLIIDVSSHQGDIRHRQADKQTDTHTHTNKNRHTKLY